MPSSVTTTSSSMRTPKRAVEVDARLDRDDVAGHEDVGRLGREARSLVHVEAETMAEAVPHRAGERALVDHAARERVGVDAGETGADAVERGLLCEQHGLVDLLRLARRAARWRRCACSRTRSRRSSCRRRSRRARPRRSCGRPRARAGASRSGPSRRSTRTRGRSPPSSWKSCVRSHATSRSVRPTNGTSVSRSKTRSVIAQARRSASSSLSSFTARSCSTRP